jgi:hypothetical protein
MLKGEIIDTTQKIPKESKRGKTWRVIDVDYVRKASNLTLKT